MKIYTLTFLIAICSSFSAQKEILPNNNYSCASAFKVCDSIQQSFRFGSDKCTIQPLYFHFHFTASAAQSLKISLAQSGASCTMYGPFESESISNCDAILNYQAIAQNFAVPLNGSTFFSNEVGYYILKITPTDCSGSIAIKSLDNKILTCNETRADCETCVTSFSPNPGKYVVSAWVKEVGALQSTVSYQKPSIRVSFTNNSTTYLLSAQGSIIDGWQRIESIIEIPASATAMSLKLQVSSGQALFDDIRFFPNDGSMMSYVYDPQSLRLMAELDERNYATLYEYDEEGKLIRLKKETEKGVMTIQENRDNIKKE